MSAPNPFLADNFAPVREETQLEDLRVIGELPRDMNGMFVRVGPNPQFEPIGTYHWFDGDGMLHGVRVQDGKATYRNRYVQTKGFEIERQRGRAIWSGLMEPPQFDNPDGPFKKRGQHSPGVARRAAAGAMGGRRAAPHQRPRPGDGRAV